MNIFLEIFGYVGTALVLLSMMMTSVVKLRLFNTVGSFISMIYAFLSGAWPVVFLNLGLIIINVWQLVKLNRTETVFECVKLGADDKSLGYFMNYHGSDITQHFPGYQITNGQNTEVYMVYTSGESVGVLIGSREGDTLFVEFDYSTVKYRDCSVGAFLYGQLKNDGIRKLVSERKGDYHNQYLIKMGFAEENGKFCIVL